MNENMMQPEETTQTEPIVQVRGLGSIILNVSDRDRSVKFYTEVLGFTEGEQMLEPGVTLVAGDASIYITDGRQKLEQKEHLRDPEVSLMLVARDLRSVVSKIESEGIEIVEDFTEFSEHFSSFSIADPDGIMITLVGKP